MELLVKPIKHRKKYKKTYAQKQLGDLTLGAVTAITGAKLVGTVGKVI